MITQIVIYCIVGLASCFTMMAIQRVYDVRDDMCLFMGPFTALLFWPIAIPLMLVFFLLKAISGLADKAADRIKDNQHKK